MHATISNWHILRISTFLDDFKLFIDSFSQLVELLFYVTSQIQFPVNIRHRLLIAWLNNVSCYSITLLSWWSMQMYTLFYKIKTSAIQWNTQKQKTCQVCKFLLWFLEASEHTCVRFIFLSNAVASLINILLPGVWSFTYMWLFYDSSKLTLLSNGLIQRTMVSNISSPAGITV